MQTLFFLLALPSFTFCLGRKHCSWGPSYWCSSLPQASVCSATDECIEQVWQDLAVPDDHGDVCTICKEMVDKARQLISANQTKEILEILEETSCAFIPISVISYECKQLVEKYGPELLKILSSKMDPIRVCTIIGLCNSAKINILLEHAAMEKMEQEKEIIDCRQCGEAVNTLSNHLAAKDKYQIEDNMLELCVNFNFSSACEATVLDQFQNVLSWVTQFLNSGICHHSLICGQDFNTEDDQCQHCQKVVQFYIDVYVKNSSLAEFKMVLDSVCERLEGPNVDSCKTMVAAYYGIIYEFLKTSVDPHKVCAIFEICDHIKQDNLIPRITNQDDLPLAHQHFSSSRNDASCVLCENVLHELQTYLANGQTQEQIQEQVNKICDISSASAGCQNFIDTYGSSIVYFLTHQIDPAHFCKLLHICNQQLKESAVVFHHIATDSSCVFCKYVITTLDGILEDKTNEKEIKDALETLCSFLPMFSKQCDSFVEKYTDMIINLLIQGITPDQICVELGLCEPNKDITALEMYDNNYQDIEINANLPMIWEFNSTARLITTDTCILCKYVITTLDGILEDKTNEKEIKDALETICSYLPMFSKKCDIFVEKYTDMIIDMFTQEITPDQICVELGLCESNKDITALEMDDNNYRDIEIQANLPMIWEYNSTAHLITTDACILCKYVITTLDGILEDKTNEKEIKDALETICSYLPMFSKKCDTFVEKYTDMIIDMFTQGVTPDQICVELGLCETNKDVTALEMDDNNYQYVKIHANFPIYWEYNSTNHLITTDSCILCKYVITTLDGILEDKTNEKEIKEALDTICSYLPMFSKQCDSFVEKYTDMIIGMFTQGITPDQICIQLGLCGPKNGVTLGYDRVGLDNDSNQDVDIKRDGPIFWKYNDTSPLCTLCSYVIQELHNAVKDKRNEDKIRQTLDVICKQLSVPIRKQCLKLIKQFEEEIIELFIKDTDAKMVCSEIGVCVDNQINSNHIPFVYLEHSPGSGKNASAALVGNSKSDKYVDDMCVLLRSLVKEKGLDPADLPTQKVAFHQTILGVTWYGSASVYNGKFNGLSTIKRSGSSSFNMSGKVATETAYLSVENPTAHYNADASFMTLRVGAGVTVWISDVQMYIVANMDLLDHGSRPQISQFKITHIGDIVVNVEGLGPLDWILNSLVNSISNLIKDWIGQLVEGPLRDVLQEVLNKIIPPT